MRMVRGMPVSRFGVAKNHPDCFSFLFVAITLGGASTPLEDSEKRIRSVRMSMLSVTTVVNTSFYLTVTCRLETSTTWLLLFPSSLVQSLESNAAVVMVYRYRHVFWSSTPHEQMPSKTSAASSSKRSSNHYHNTAISCFLLLPYYLLHVTSRNTHRPHCTESLSLSVTERYTGRSDPKDSRGG